MNEVILVEIVLHIFRCSNTNDTTFFLCDIVCFEIFVGAYSIKCRIKRLCLHTNQIGLNFCSEFGWIKHFVEDFNCEIGSSQIFFQVGNFFFFWFYISIELINHFSKYGCFLAIFRKVFVQSLNCVFILLQQGIDSLNVFGDFFSWIHTACQISRTQFDGFFPIANHGKISLNWRETFFK